jgi:hypothetical protein
VFVLILKQAQNLFNGWCLGWSAFRRAADRSWHANAHWSGVLATIVAISAAVAATLIVRPPTARS